MVDISRRQAIVVGGGAVVVAAGGVTVLGGGDGGDGTPGESGGNAEDGDSSGGTNVIQSSEVVEGGSGSADASLRIQVVESAADRIVLQADGEEIPWTDTEVASAESQVTIPISGVDVIPPSTNEIVAYSGETIVDRVEWSPTIDLSVADVEAAEWLRVSLNNNSDIEIAPTRTYVSGGFPTEVHGSDKVADYEESVVLSPLGDQRTYDIRRKEAAFEKGVLTPPNEECTGDTLPVEVTFEFEQLEPRTYTMDVKLAGDPREGPGVGEPIYCSEATATLTDSN